MTVMPGEIHDERDAVEIYEIAPSANGWTIYHGGRNEGSLRSKIAAWDAALSAAFPRMLAGSSVVVKVTGIAAPERPRN